jgi:hypothetical protein
MSLSHASLKHLIENADDRVSLKILAGLAREEGLDCYRLAHRPGASQQRAGERSARDLFTDQQKLYEALEIQAVERRGGTR